MSELIAGVGADIGGVFPSKGVSFHQHRSLPIRAMGLCTCAHMCTCVNTLNTEERFLVKSPSLGIFEFSKVLNLPPFVPPYFLFSHVINELPGILCSSFPEYVGKDKPDER